MVDELADRGLRVRSVARHRAADLPGGVEIVEADITDPAEARRAMAGAAVIYHAASAAYHRWPELLPPLMRGVLAGAVATGARIVYADNLYAYGPVDGPLTEDLPSRATGPNGRVRAALADELMAADAAGTVRATIGRASDYYGPWGRQSTVGERLFEPALAGKRVQLLGDPDLPHTRHLPRRLRARTGDPRHARCRARPGVAPAQRRDPDVPRVRPARVRGDREPVARSGVMPSPLLSVAALFSPTLRAVKEQQYQRERPWVVDHSKFARAFGADVTPHREAIDHTLAWYRAIGSQPSTARRS